MPQRPVEPPAVKVLFRYRDLVQPTLQRHREILDQKGRVWWGWWKRPTEDARLDVWSFLQEELAANKRIRVGLFDSGEKDSARAVRAAWIDAVRIPQREDPTALDPLKLRGDEAALVPLYYRDSPFSRAWMRIVEFEDEPFPFFERYSFEEVPPHLHYSPAAVERLTGKIIWDSRELREMDSTLWRVRMRRDGDKTEQVVTARAQVTEPLSDAPIKTNGTAIVHITDPHFATGDRRRSHVWRLESETEERESLASSVARALDGRRVGALIVTGDLTMIGDPAEFEEAKNSLNHLVGRFGLGPEHVVIVPGNHDIRWAKPKDQKYVRDEDVAVPPAEATEPYRNFYKSFFGHPADGRLAMARRYALGHGGLLDVCGVNSSSLATGQDFLAGMGRVDLGSLDTAAKKLGWGTSRSSLAVRLLALHHHLVPTNDAEDPAEYYTGFGMAMDATGVQRVSARNGVHLALHGHRHRAFLWRSDVYEMPEDAREEWAVGPLSLLGGGSAGARGDGEQKNFFNTLTVGADGLTVEMFVSKNAQEFGRMATWKGPFALTAGRLELGPWFREKK